MDPAGTASRTAMMAACSRGWHLFSQGQRAVFTDWLAWPLVGATAEELTTQLFPLFGDDVPQIATWLAARQRIAEDWLASSGAEQYVVLGAGLDSYAWRTDNSVRVFEVDHPATQTWKQARLAALQLSTPDHLTWVPVDFEVESFADQLTQSGLEERPTFFSWLGVTPYLTIDAIGGALDALPPCSLAVSYATPSNLWTEDCARVSNKFLGIAEQSGEPILSLFSPRDFTSLLADHGFTQADDVGHEMIESRFAVKALANGGERIALATKTA
jgi:methyltransferase (TIGR00027 family)